MFPYKLILYSHAIFAVIQQASQYLVRSDNRSVQHATQFLSIKSLLKALIQNSIKKKFKLPLSLKNMIQLKLTFY